MVEEWSFQQMMLRQLVIHIQRIKLNSYVTQHIKIYSKWIKVLSVRAKTINLLQESIAVNLCDLQFDNDFVHMAPKTQARKETIGKLDSAKIKNFRAPKGTNRKVKGHSKE